MSGGGDVVTPGFQSVYAALVPFIIGVTGLAAANVVQGLPNRAAMPLPGFVTIQGITRKRLATNVQTWDQVSNPPMSLAIEQDIELGIQIDCYGPISADWADMLTTLLRDEYGVNALAPNVTPLYADDARMIPLVDGEEQYEERWSIDAHFQYNPVTTVPQQYANVLDITLINVQEAYPQ